MIVCVNKIDNSVCFVIKEIEELDEYLFLPDQMYFVEMAPIKGSYNTLDYVDYFVINGKWVYVDDIDRDSLKE